MADENQTNEVNTNPTEAAAVAEATPAQPEEQTQRQILRDVMAKVCKIDSKTKYKTEIKK